MTNSKNLEQAKELSTLLNKYFWNSHPRVGVSLYKGGSAECENIGRLILGHITGDSSHEVEIKVMSKKQPPNFKKGIFRCGFYAPGTDGKTKWVVLDFDGGDKKSKPLLDAKATAINTLKKMQSAGFNAYLERSGGGDGWHIWIFFETPIICELARKLGLAFAPKDAPLLASGQYADPERNIGIEIFPKQFEVKQGDCGNYVWLPFWNGAPEGANQFYQVTENEALELYLPKSFETNSLANVEKFLTSQKETHPSSINQGMGAISAQVRVRGEVPIANGCGFIEHCERNRESLSEPEWYALAGILAFQGNGLETFHRLSIGHPEYNKEVTDGKFQQARSAVSGPRTCKSISDNFAGCPQCPHYGKVHSPADIGSADNTPNNSQATRLSTIANEYAELFHTTDGDEYATVEINGHKETYPIRSQQFRKWLTQQYRRRYSNSVPGSQGIQDALNAIGANALYDGKEEVVHFRIGEANGKIYLDLCNSAWEVIEISPDGWNLLKVSPIKFRRSNGMHFLPHPAPASVDCVEELRTFFNINSEDDFRLILAWLVNCFNPKGPYLILVLYAEQGSGKSTLVKMIRDLIDPNLIPLRREPRNADDLLVSAKNNLVIAIDNMSYLQDWLSDDFCRIATGGGLSKRAHYSNDEEIVLSAKRPIILNGIDEFVVRGDLASRSIILNLPSMIKKNRRREKDLLKDYEDARPKFLGLLLNAISTALRNQDSFELEEQFRMADSWHMATAAETAFGWTRGMTIEAYRRNQLNANEVVLNSSQLTSPIRELSEENVEWSGTATALLSELNLRQNLKPGYRFNEKGWPRTPKTLSDSLRRLAPSLRMAGIAVEFNQDSGSNSAKKIIIRKILKSCDANGAKAPIPEMESAESVAVKLKGSSDKIKDSSDYFEDFPDELRDLI